MLALLLVFLPRDRDLLGQVASRQMLLGMRHMLVPYGEEVRLWVTLPGAGDSLTVLSCLYMMKAASGSVLESVGWLPNEVMKNPMVIMAGFLQDVDCWFPSLGGGRVRCLFPSLCSIATIVAFGKHQSL